MTTMINRNGLATAALLLALVGCSSSGTTTPTPSATPAFSGCLTGPNTTPPAATPIPAGASVEVGSVTDTPTGFAFKALNTCDQVGIVRGSQGGFHIWGALRARNLEPRDAQVTYTIRRADTNALVSDNPAQLVTMNAEGGGTASFNGLFGFLCPNNTRDCPGAVNSLIGKEVLMKMDVTDRNGVKASNEKRVVVQGSPIPTPAP